MHASMNYCRAVGVCGVIALTLHSGLTGVFGGEAAATKPAATAPAAQAPKALVEFRDANFGVHFSHTDAISTIYDPHGGADRVMISYQEHPIGGLTIRRAPPSVKIEEFIAAGKEYYRTQYRASSVDYVLYENPGHYRFHHLKARATLKGQSYILERYVHLRELNQLATESDVLNAISGAISFEFACPEAEYERLRPELRTLIDTFQLGAKD